ncbi:MAG: nickel pincer cofactor biosynthesis protein LarB [Saprospiraceae bacterium]|nr:nickel pincer cofactor biosynthesis protein LarB [Saprospiraceae bacterium]
MSDFNIDSDRKKRVGFPEIIYGASKSVDVLFQILNHYQQNGNPAFVTKLQEEKAVKLLEVYPEAFFDKLSGVFWVGQVKSDLKAGDIAIVSAGSADQFVVNEALYTLRFLGHAATCIQDIGVAGLHRLLNKLDELRRFKILIVVAGFEGALPTVVGGLLPQPVIAVPTSVGYGVATGGQAALQTMLASCANGIAVVNIDNGYGAALAAIRILNTFPNANKN